MERGIFVKNQTSLTAAQSSVQCESAKKAKLKKSALGLAISMVIAYPATLQALGLGELHSSSQLDQPLNAQIDLLSTNPSEARQLQVRLASPEVFSRVGIERPAFLENLKFTPVIQNGKPVIKVTSSAPVSETFLNFLLEVSWPQGQLLKEYTVLLDPPVLLNSGNAVADNSAAVRAEPKPATARPQATAQAKGVIQRNQQVAARQAQIQAQQQARQTAQADQANIDPEFVEQAQAVLSEKSAPARSVSSRYRVKRGDTISRIASRLRYRGVSNSQMMVALFRANPHAFIKDNINYLKSGSLLTRPAKSEVTQYSAAESKRIVKQHYAQWKKYRAGLAEHTVAQTPVTKSNNAAASGVTTAPNANASDKPKLKVAGTDGDSSVSSDKATAELQKELTLAQEALASSKSENAELRSRVTQLEAIIRKKERLITLKNDRLAKLEEQLRNGGKISPNALEGKDTDVATTTPDKSAQAEKPTTVIPAPPINEPDDLATQVANQDQQNNNRIIRGEDTPGTEETTGEAVTQSNVDTALSSPETRTVEQGDNTDKEIASNPFVDQEQSENDSKGSILDLLSTPLVTAIGGGSLLALLLGWLLMRRSAKTEDDEVEAVGKESHDDDLFDDDLVSSELDQDTAENTELVSSDNTASADDVEQLFSDSTDGSDAIDSILSGDDAVEEDEIIQEADVYIVYGLHEQAEDELKKAISNNPDKLEYRYKLLENYKVANDPESFVTSSKEFLKAAADQPTEKSESLWNKIVAWGKEIAPENELFSTDSSLEKGLAMVGGVATAGAAAKVAQEAFSEAMTGDDTTASTAGNAIESALPDLDSDMAEMNDALDDALGDTDFNLEDELGLGDDLDLDDDFGLDELVNEIDSGDSSTNNVLSFGSPDADTAGTEKSEGINLDLEIDQDTGLDKILPSDSAYTTSSNELEGSTDEGLDDALSFLDLSDDDEEMQQAHISTKLDLARAYLDMGDVEGARHTLEEVVIEGNDDQKREAEELLQQTG